MTGQCPRWSKLWMCPWARSSISSGASRRMGWQGRSRTGPRPAGIEYWMTGQRPHLIALACSPTPEGHEHWNLRLLGDRMVELGVAGSLIPRDNAPAPEKTAAKRDRRSSGAFPR